MTGRLELDDFVDLVTTEKSRKKPISYFEKLQINLSTDIYTRTFLSATIFITVDEIIITDESIYGLIKLTEIFKCAKGSTCSFYFIYRDLIRFEVSIKECPPVLEVHLNKFIK